LRFAHPLGMPQPKIDEQARASMHEGGGVTDSGEPVGLLYTNLKDPSRLADLLLDERVDIRLVRGTCLKALDRQKQTFIRRHELENHPRYPDAFVTREELQKWKTDAAYRSKVRIIGVSHVWETREHPDPRGNQLASIDLAPFEEADRQKHVQVFFTETGVPQDGKVEVRPLADLIENATPYSRRGWCEAECQWSSMRSKSRQTVSLSFVSPETWTRAPCSRTKTVPRP